MKTAPASPGDGCRTSVSSTSRAVQRTNWRCDATATSSSASAWVPRTLASVGTPTSRRRSSRRVPTCRWSSHPTGFTACLAAGRPRAGEGCGGRGHTVHAQHRFELSVAKLTAESPGRTWFQPLPDEGWPGSSIASSTAREAGCRTMVVTTDVPIFGAREWDQRKLPRADEAWLASVLDVLAHPGWLRARDDPERRAAVREHPRVSCARQRVGAGRRALHGYADQLEARLGRHRAHSRALAAQAVLKGVLCVEDAPASRGGRAPTASCCRTTAAVSSIRALPRRVAAAVAAEVGNRITVLVDGGFSPRLRRAQGRSRSARTAS